MGTGQTVLLAHSFFVAHDAKQTRKMKPYPPLATLITASVLRDAGHRVALFDATLSAGEEEYSESLAAAKPDVVGLLEDNFNFLTKMCTTRMREAALRMIRATKEAGVPIVVNGSDASDRPEIYLEAGADAVILGETERTLPELLDALSGGSSRDLSPIAGLALPGPSGSVSRTAPRPFVNDLDALPLPAWDLVDVSRYRSVWKAAHGRLSWNVVTTRGCPFHCNWCAKPLYGVRYAQRSPGSVAEELVRLKRFVGPGHVWFADDIFGLTPRWIESFAEEVAARGARIPFTMQSRADLMTPSAVVALAASGCEEVWMGVESGSQRILDAMEKGLRVGQVRRATRLLREHGIRVAWFLQLGYSGEEWEDLLATRELLRSERPDDIGVSVAYPLPGTLFHERVKAQLTARTNWKDTDDLAMLFEGTYSSDFYRQVRDVLHAEAFALNAPHSDLTDAGIEAAWADLGRQEAADRARRSSRGEDGLLRAAGGGS
jgi:anaerobic magnesium-protoporphyrin IX monomethyl ester cyclase